MFGSRPPPGLLDEFFEACGARHAHVEIAIGGKYHAVVAVFYKIFDSQRISLLDRAAARRIATCLEVFEVFFIFRDDNKKLQAIIHADTALWNEEKELWELQSAVQFENQDGLLLKTAPAQVYLSQLTESYEIFRKTTIDVANVNAADAKIYINHLRKAGLPYNEQLSVYYKKFSFPFILFIAAFLAVGLTGKTRKNVLLISLSLSIVAVVLFYVFQMMTMVLAKTGVMTPFMGAWLPDIYY